MDASEVVGSYSAKTNITKENISDIMTTALEGGSNYWVNSLEGDMGEYKDWPKAIADGLEFMVLIDDHPNEVINVAKLVHGLAMYHAKNDKMFDMEFRETDASDADAVLQYALFSELVFG